MAPQQDFDSNDAFFSDAQSSDTKPETKQPPELDCFELRVNFQEIQQQQLEILYGPGLYEIYCVHTLRSYFGETTSLFERLGQHYRALQAGEKIQEAPQLQQDWQHYGLAAFRFRILLSGTKWNSLSLRRQQESELITQAAPNVYNKFPQILSSYRMPCIIQGIQYTSIKQAAASLGISASEIRRRVENPNFSDYILEDKISFKKPFELDGVVYQNQKQAMENLQLSRQSVYRRRRAATKKSKKTKRVCRTTIPKGSRVQAYSKREPLKNSKKRIFFLTGFFELKI
jgi:hypothetical protein